MNSHSLSRISGFVPSTAVLSGVIGLLVMSGCGGAVIADQDRVGAEALWSGASKITGRLLNIDFGGDGTLVGMAGVFGYSSSDTGIHGTSTVHPLRSSGATGRARPRLATPCRQIIKS